MIKRGKPLIKLNNKDFLDDVKKYIKNTREFYKDKNPELEILAGKFYEEYSLVNFYKIFNKLWNSGLNGDRELALLSFKLYKDEFDIITWKFLERKFKEIRNIEELNFIGEMISYIYRKNQTIIKDILYLSKSNDIWIKRISISACFYIVKRDLVNNQDILIEVIKRNIHDDNIFIQQILGFLLKKISKSKKEEIKMLILKNHNLPDSIYFQATEKMKYLRKLRQIKKLNSYVR